MNSKSKKIEKDKANFKNHIISSNTKFDVKEVYKAIRTNIIFSIPGNECKSIIITSPFPSEGKTTNCSNLAITFAQTGAKVLMIDADLRKPMVHKVFNITSKIGLSNILSGQIEIPEGILKTECENLDVIISGQIPPNPAELLASQPMKDLLQNLNEKYDYIFIDTPPINVVTDATILSTMVSGVILVVRQAITDHKSVQNAISKLQFANANILGFILNDIHRKDPLYKYRIQGYNKYGYSRHSYYKNGTYK